VTRGVGGLGADHVGDAAHGERPGGYFVGDGEGADLGDLSVVASDGAV